MINLNPIFGQKAQQVFLWNSNNYMQNLGAFPGQIQMALISFLLKAVEISN